MAKQFVRPADENIFFTPAELGSLYVEYGDSLQKEPGINWGVASIDKQIIPIRKGQLAFIVARPGHGKSTVASYLTKRTAQALRDEGAKDKCVVYISLDQPVEEIYAMLQSDEQTTVSDYAWGKLSHDALTRKAVQAVDLPVWAIGRSVTQRRAPKLTFENIYRGLGEMERLYKIRPVLAVIDYIQIVPIENKQNRTEQVGEAVIRARELAAQLACPMLILAQAGRQVDSYDNKIPGLADCQHASAIEQDADKVFGVWRPKLTESDETISVRQNGKEIDIPVTENLFVMRVNKQRMSKAGQTFYLHLDPAMVRLSDLELQNESST
jgi:replicative DNA helicase